MLSSERTQKSFTQALDRTATKLLEVLDASNEILSTLKATTEAERFQFKRLDVKDLDKIRKTNSNAAPTKMIMEITQI